ncbi:MAG: xanthine dehydrogenase family protein molybdopterin-binding subunit [Pseudomonadales bacterium]
MKTITRRQLMKSGATAAGGMMISFHIPAFGKAEPYKPWETDNAEINAWLVIDPDDTITIRVAQSEMGEGVFTSMPMLVAEELEADWRNVRAEYASVNRSIREDRVYKRMGTGGSGAVRRSREYLQKAGAEAREKLIKAAAEKWYVDPKDCYADYGRVHHRSSDRSINYGAIAADAAKVSVANVEIKKPKDFNLLGLPKNRLDVPAKVDGSAQFGMDVRVPGMVYAAVVHCPVLGGTVRSFRFNAIRNNPGVLEAVKLENGVAVVAEHYWQAKTASEQLPVDWNIGEEGKTSSEQFKNEFMAALKEDGVVVASDGDSHTAMEQANNSIESDYIVPYLAHACMEPLNCTVHIQDDRVDVWTGTQNPESALAAAADVAGVAPEKVYVHNCFLGGGFGRRSNPDYVREAVAIAREIGKPVQMIWSREEDMRQGRYRPMAAMRFKAGFDRDKNLTAYTNHSVAHSILAEIRPDSVEDGVDRTSVEGLQNMPYAAANKKITHTIKNTHMTTWFWRSVGSSQNAFALECFVDEMAAAAEKDPLQFRRELLAGHPEMLNVLNELARKADWGKSMPKGSAQGLAIHESFGSIVGQVAEVTISTDGELKVDKIVSAVDCGNLVNPKTAEMQIESGIIYGLTAALYGKLTIEQGRILETNFDTYHMVHMDEAPVMETHFALAGGDKWGGMGEPGLPPTAPAVCNAIYKVTGKRIRSLPIKSYVLQRA